MNGALLIVDGYNVLHALFPGASKDELFARRDWLSERIASVIALRGGSAMLVFDAHNAETTHCRPLKGVPLEVCFAGGRFTADTLIARRIAEQPADVAVTVVSGDQEVQRTAARAGVSRMTPREFAAMLEQPTKAVDSLAEASRIPSRLEDKVDVETLRKLEALRRNP
ncbi:MAG: NYN domain-containing protein [Thermoleophilia bacterium]